MSPIAIDITYIMASCLFIFGMKQMSRVRSARNGNFLAALGMFIAVVITLFETGIVSYQWIIVGIVIGSLIGALSAHFVQMTAMPQMVGIFNGFGGIASALVASEAFLSGGISLERFALITIVLGTFIGSVTFTGSMIAFGKLQGIVTEKSVTYPLQKTINAVLALTCVGLGIGITLDPGNTLLYWLVMATSCVLGILLVLPIGGADMPVVVSLLNSYSGVAAAMTGFVLMNKVLIVAGSLVGAAGLILTQIMCKAMNRSLANVAFGTFGGEDSPGGGKDARDYKTVKSCDPEEAAMVMEAAEQVVIVPGYGLAVARAQHAIKQLSSVLEAQGKTVKYAIHPVAGRMPGHMNVLLAEAEVPYEALYEMDDINPEFSRTDVVLVVGANDVTNPAARNEKGSPIYGMPILNVDQARSVIIIKRSLSPGFAGIKNPLFENENSMMLFGDAKVMIEALSKESKALATT